MTYEPPLDGYICAGCGASGIKLWREYQTFAPRLVCARCCANRQNLSGIEAMDAEGVWVGKNGRPTNQIGWFVPAVPHPDGDGYWGYTSVPSVAFHWWRRLPTFPELVAV